MEPVARVPAPVALPDTYTNAFADLYTAGYRGAYRLLGDRDLAEDIAQEACARACMRWRKVEQCDSPAAWVARVAMNLAIDRWRRIQRDRARHVEAPEPVEPDDGRRVDLHRALATLTRRQRDVVVLRYVADYSEAETAHVLGCAVGTVKSHASRGLTALREALDDGTDS